MISLPTFFERSKYVSLVVAVGIALAVTSSSGPALAQHVDWHGGGRGGGGDWHGGWPQGWRGYGRGGFAFGFGGPGYYGYPYDAYPYPYAYGDPYVYPPPAVAPVPGQTAWYCPSANAYYPQVPTCPVPWVQGPG